MLCLLLLSFSLQSNYDSEWAAELLKSSREELVGLFKQNISTNDSKSGLEKLHRIALIRQLLEFCGGRRNLAAREYSKDFSSDDNAEIYGSLLGAAGKGRLGTADLRAMHRALLSSKAIADMAIDTGGLSAELIKKLPIGYPQDFLGVGHPTDFSCTI